MSIAFLGQPVPLDRYEAQLRDMPTAEVDELRRKMEAWDCTNDDEALAFADAVIDLCEGELVARWLDAHPEARIS